VTALLELGAEVGWVDAEAAGAAREHVDPRAGRLGELVEWVAATQGQFPTRALRRIRCVIVGTVSAPVLDLASGLGIGTRALTPPTDTAAAFRAGAELADAEIESGADLLVLAAPDDTPAAATLVGLLTDTEPVALLPRGVAALDSAAWIARAAALRDARREAQRVRTRPDELLKTVGSTAIAAAAGVALRAAARRTPVVLDGTATLAGALLCLDIQPRASQWWRLADTSPDRVFRRAVERVELRPLLDLGTDLADGTAGLLAAGLLRAALAMGRRDD
jgi:nicotinate-nucleotide--dimethylbenzimidazole phosphoribosyltransferase